jgi:hypothetical protein
MSKEAIKDIRKKCKFFATVLRNKQLLAENEKIMQEASALTKQDMRAVKGLSLKNDKAFETHTGITSEEAKELVSKQDPKILKQHKDTIDRMSREINDQYTKEELFTKIGMQQVYHNMQRTTALVQKYKENEGEIAKNKKVLEIYFKENPANDHPKILNQCMEMYKQEQRCDLANLFFEHTLQVVDNADDAKWFRDNWSCDDTGL